MDEKEKDKQLKIEDIPILQDFKYIFPEEIPGVPPKRDIFYNRFGTGGGTRIKRSLLDEYSRCY